MALGRGSLGSIHMDALNPHFLLGKGLCGLVPELSDICQVYPSGRTCPGALGTRSMSLVPKFVHGHLPFLSPASVDPLVFSAPLYLLIKVYRKFQNLYLSHKGSGEPHASPPTYQDTGSDSISPSFSNHVRTSDYPRTDFL